MNFSNTIIFDKNNIDWNHLNDFQDIITKNLIGSFIKQNCGDIFEILDKEIRKGHCYYKVKSLKYNNEFFCTKDKLIAKNCINPELDNFEFVGKIFPQNCGDNVKVLKKTNIKDVDNSFLFEVEYQKYPYKEIKRKFQIIRGLCVNPLIEKYEFIDKIWPQNCGDSVRILKKTNEIKCGYILYEIEFIKYPYRCKRSKSDIINGHCDNPNLPWRNKISLEQHILKVFKDKKPTYLEIANSFNTSFSTIYKYITKFNLKSLISLIPNYEQDSLKEYIQSVYNENIIENFGNSKKYNYQEIDIYLPKLKIGFEYNGFRWHEEGNSNNPYSRPIGYHQEKFNLFFKEGIIIFNIWDYFWWDDNKHSHIRLEAQQYIKSIIDAFTIKKLPQLI